MNRTIAQLNEIECSSLRVDNTSQEERERNWKRSRSSSERILCILELSIGIFILKLCILTIEMQWHEKLLLTWIYIHTPDAINLNFYWKMKLKFYCFKRFCQVQYFSCKLLFTICQKPPPISIIRNNNGKLKDTRITRFYRNTMLFVMMLLLMLVKHARKLHQNYSALVWLFPHKIYLGQPLKFILRKHLIQHYKF